MDLQKELERCAKCGQCRSVCPVFLALKDETLVARGRLAIIHAQEESSKNISALYTKILNTCLMCRRCQENCPSLVDTGAVFKAERQRLAEEKGLPLLLRLGFRWVLPNRRLYDILMRLVSLANRLLGRDSAPVRHLPLYFSSLFQRLPRLAARSALDIYKRSALHAPGSEFTQPLTGPVSIFVGCAANYIYPDIIEALVAVLDKLKIPYVIPRGQVCCGMPALLSGDTKTADKLGNINRELFKSDTIITVCPTCNRMLKEMRGSEWGMGNKIVDAMEFLQSKLPEFSIPHSALRTSYHAPCHSAGTKAPEIIRDWLKAHTDYKAIDDVCCGGGGLFSFKYPELSDQIGQARLKSLFPSDCGVRSEDCGIENNKLAIRHSPFTIVTNCPGCIMQLEYLLVSKKRDIKVRHILNLIRDVYKTG